MELSIEKKYEVIKQVQKESPFFVKTTTVIEVGVKRGDGTPGDPVRIVFQYWSEDGKLLAESDSVENSNINEQLVDV